MMGCCAHLAIEEEFNRRVVSRDLARYRRQGPDRTTRLLLAALLTEGMSGRTLLDIGGGVGAISHALLQAGTEHATIVEAASAYLEAAQAEAAHQGHADRLSLRHGDFVALADSIPPADIVTLDRVICCYPDMPALVERSVSRARFVYGLVYPRDTWWIRFSNALLNRLYWLRRSSFRSFVHSTAAVDALVRGAGFTPRINQTTAIWQIIVYARP